MSTFEAAALTRSRHPAEQAVPTQEQHPGRGSVFERPEFDRLGDGVHGRAGPGDRVRVRVGVQDAQLEPVGKVVRGRVDAGRSPEDAKPGLDGRQFRSHIVDGLAACQA
jgi:hypothetical protein